MRITENLNNAWLFTKGGAKTPITVDLPHTWNAFDGQDGGADYYRGKGTYSKKVQRPDVPASWDIYLEFEGVNSVAEVYADGSLLAGHRGGYSTFRAKATEAFAGKSEVEIKVVADNSNISDVYPQMADFTFYGGIYRDVTLIAVPATHFDLDHHGSEGVAYTAKIDGDKATLEATCWVTAPTDADRVLFRLADAEGETVAESWEVAKEVTKAVFDLEGVHLWNGIKDPYLYTLSFEIVRNNSTIDWRDVNCGFRTFYCDPQKGFFLNGVLTPLRGVSRHQDRMGIGNALTAEEHYEDALIIRELGANTIRLAHYQHNQAFYDACDELGFVVWAEIPFISSMNEDPKAHDNCRSQMTELVLQNFNHPSICFWGISNEITIAGDKPGLYENLRDLNDLAHQLDPTRLTTMAQVSMLPMDDRQNDITDVVSYNHYFGWYGGSYTKNEEWFDAFHKMWPNRPFGLSEYGCEGIISWHSDEPKCKDYSEEYQAEYHEHMAKILDERPWMWASHVWNMFDFGADNRDEGGVMGRNNKGLVTFDRAIRKDSYYVYKAYWSDDPFVHVAGRRYAERPYSEMDVKVYSNQKSVILIVNGAAVAELEGDRVFVFRGVKLTEGRNSIEAVAGNCSDKVWFTRVEKANPAYVLPAVDDEAEAEGARNWFNEQAASAPLEMTFDPAYFSVKDLCSDVCANDEAYEALAAFAKTKSAGVKLSKSMLAGMMGTQPVEKLASFVGGDDSEEGKIALRVLNAMLQEVKK